MNHPARANSDTVAFEHTRNGLAQAPRPESRSSSSLLLSAGLWSTAALTLFGVALSTLAVNEVIDWTLRKEIHDKQLVAPNALLATIRAEEANRLNHYRRVRKEDGIVRVPIGRAKQLVMHDYTQNHEETLPQPRSTGGKP